MNSKQIARIFDSDCRAAFAVTGGGSGALHALLSTPGASRFVADARIPYSPEALERFLGEKIEHSCSPETARALATKAFELTTDNVESALRADLRSESARYTGVGCTAALQTDRARRGDDRAFICIKTEQADKLYALYFSQASRAEQEALLSDWLLLLIAQTVGAERGLMLPGSFNPVHQGHLGILKAAEQITGLRGIFELSAANVDKPGIPEDEMLRRASSIRDIPVALTRAARFTQKAELFPNTTFVLGHDTAERLLSVNHTLESVVNCGSKPWKNKWEKFQTLEISFLVAGRIFQCSEAVGAGGDRAHRARLQSFQCLENLKLPSGFESLFEAIPEEIFREDISSTELRESAHE